MNENVKKLITVGWELFTRIFMKYEILEKMPVDIGVGDKLKAAQIHTIEAIGKEYGNTVTALSSYFMITKSAVSQITAKLHKMGYIAKTKKKGNDKEIILELTKKGWKAFNLHEDYNQPVLDDLIRFEDKYSEDEIRSFLSILNDIDLLLNKFIDEEKTK